MIRRVTQPTVWGAAALAVIAFGAPASVTAGAPARPVATAVMADAPTIKKAITADRGHVVVVNFWATWCVPCVAEFPALVKLQDNYASQGVEVMAVSADQGELYIRRVGPFLAAQKANFPAYILRSGNQQQSINAFDRKWEGDLPRTFVYDKRGRLAKTLSGEQTYATFESAIKPLL